MPFLLRGLQRTVTARRYNFTGYKGFRITNKRKSWTIPRQGLAPAVTTTLGRRAFSIAAVLRSKAEASSPVNNEELALTHDAIEEANDSAAWYSPDYESGDEAEPPRRLQRRASRGGFREFMKRNIDSAEIKDPQIIFKKVISNLRTKYGHDLVFPKYLIWLCGAPGAGKGTMTPYILKETGITAQPIVVSNLLNSPQAQEIKAKGRLLGDREVVEELFDALIAQKNEAGVVIDGYPRTKIQAECIKLLYDYMLETYRKNLDREDSPYPRPVFHIVVLYVEEEESVARQIARGRVVSKHNQTVRATGIGRMIEERVTDISETAARDRYRIFKEQVYESLMVIKNAFHFHFIDAGQHIQEVMRLVKQEFEYQSSMELSDEALVKVRQMPKASRLIENARMELVKRIEMYTHNNEELFDKVLNVMKTEFLHILRRQSVAGRAIIRSQNPIFEDPLALNIFLDVAHDRGFIVVPDVVKEPHVSKLLPGTTVSINFLPIPASFIQSSVIVF